MTNMLGTTSLNLKCSSDSGIWQFLLLWALLTRDQILEILKPQLPKN